MHSCGQGGEKMAVARQSFKESLKVDTMDIVIAVVIGAVQAAFAISGALGYIEKVLVATGPLGLYIFCGYSGLLATLIPLTGYLRKSVTAVTISGFAYSFVRWIAGDPDAVLLVLFYVVGALIAGVVLWAFQWRPTITAYFLAGGLLMAYVQVIWSIFLGLAEFGFWVLALSVVICGISGGILGGILPLYIGKGVERAGIPVKELAA
jgi:hypothetical protein